jgi:anaerobic selenocysteine-containing dehydrogenase
MFTRPAADLIGLADLLGLRGSFARRRTRVRGLPEFSGEWPACTLAEEIEEPGQGQLRALVTLAGNPVLSTPNGTRLERALPGLEFQLAVDFYVNETSRHAHLILPPTFALERDHYDLVFHLLAVRNTAKYTPALFPRGPEQRHDWEILLELSARLMRARGARLRAWLTRATLGRLGPTGLVDWLLRFGPQRKLAGGGRLNMKRLRAEPHGLDLGPLEPCLPQRLVTSDRRVRLAPPTLSADLNRLERFLAQEPPALALIGRRDLRSNNSWMHNSERLVKGRERCTLLMHPHDAAERRLKPGQRVRVSSPVGAIEVPLEISADMAQGVVSLPHGWGHDRDGVRLRVATSRPGASVNDLNDDRRVDELCGTAAFSGQPVEVEPAPEARVRSPE